MKIKEDNVRFLTRGLAITITILGLFGGGEFAHATLNLGDAANYAVIFQGGGANRLAINNGAGPNDTAIVGNVGIANTGMLGLSGPLIVDGNIDFAGAVNPGSYTSSGPYVNGNVTVTGGIRGGQTIVQNAMNYLNLLSAALGAEAGTSINLVPGTVINASAGIIDASGNSVFTVTSMNLPNGTVTINGDGVHSVVINMASVANFHANNIVLTGGLTPDQVLWNFYGGDSSTLSGGPTMDINSNGGTLAGIFLDPNGAVSIVHTVLNGRVFGGDTHNMQVVSGDYITAPVPEPTTVIVGALLLLPFGASVVRSLRKGRKA